jgi:hypothetical protein
MNETDRDTLLRMAAFEHVRRLSEVHDHLTAAELKPGFIVDGERIPLINPQRGIFKPRQMRFLLSIKTVFPRPGGKVWYDDQREVHRQIFDGDETIDCAHVSRHQHPVLPIWGTWRRIRRRPTSSGRSLAQPPDRRGVDVVGARDVGLRLTGIETVQGFPPLVCRQLARSPEPYAPFLGPLAPLARPGPDELALELRKTAQHRQDEPAMRCRGVGPGVAQ